MKSLKNESINNYNKISLIRKWCWLRRNLLLPDNDMNLIFDPVENRSKLALIVGWQVGQIRP